MSSYLVKRAVNRNVMMDVLSLLADKSAKTSTYGGKDFGWVRTKDVLDALKTIVPTIGAVQRAIELNPSAEQSIIEDTTRIDPATWLTTIYFARAASCRVLKSKLKTLNEFRVKRIDNEFEFPESELAFIFTPCNPNGEFAGDFQALGADVLDCLNGNSERGLPKQFVSAAGTPRKNVDLYKAILSCAPPVAQCKNLAVLSGLFKGSAGRKMSAVSVPNTITVSESL